MKSPRIQGLALGLIALLIWLACSGAPKTLVYRLKPGDTAPTFALRLLDGDEMISAGSVFYNSNATVVIIWNMSCPTCRQALIECQKLYDEFSKKAISFIGINFDRENLHGVRAFLRSEGITFPNVWDGRGRIAKKYFAFDYSFSAFVVTRQGKITFVQYDHPPDFYELMRKAIETAFEKEIQRQQSNKK